MDAGIERPELEAVIRELETDMTGEIASIALRELGS